MLASEQLVGPPWWVTILTGSGGALFVQFMWIKNLTDNNKLKDKTIESKDKELMEISKESIECITRILERQTQDTAWKLKIEELFSKTNGLANQRNKEE